MCLFSIAQIRPGSFLSCIFLTNELVEKGVQLTYGAWERPRCCAGLARFRQRLRGIVAGDGRAAAAAAPGCGQGPPQAHQGSVRHPFFFFFFFFFHFFFFFFSFLWRIFFVLSRSLPCTTPGLPKKKISTSPLSLVYILSYFFYMWFMYFGF
jgi:hypothetical protein